MITDKAHLPHLPSLILALLKLAQQKLLGIVSFRQGHIFEGANVTNAQFTSKH